MAERGTGNEAQSIFDSLALWTLFAVVALVPVFFVPSLFFPFQFSKTALIGVGVLLALVFFVVARLQEHALTLPWEPLVWGLVALPVAYILSGVFSAAPATFLGYSFDQYTAGFVLLSALSALLVAAVARTRAHILFFYASFLIPFFLLALYHLIRLVTPAGFLSFGLFATPSSGPFGFLNELGMFFGLVAILALVTLVGLHLSGKPRWLVLAALSLGLFFLVLTNVKTIWWLVGIAALGTFVYSVLKRNFPLGRERDAAHKEYEDAAKGDTAEGVGLFASLVVLALALIFMLGSEGLTSAVASFFRVGQLDIRPSWQTTIDIGKKVYGESFLFGSGPGTFARDWAKYRPAEINQTIVWNTDFVGGVGYLPTIFVTGGAVTLIAWAAFFALFIWVGVRALLVVPVGDSLSYYLSLSSFIGSLYLWVLAFVSQPSATLIYFAFFLTGIFIASLRFRLPQFKEVRISFSENPRWGFATVLGLTLVVLGSVAMVFSIGERYAAAYHYQHGAVLASGMGTVDQALGALGRALVFDEQDRIYRLASDLDLVQLSRQAAETPNPTEEERAQFQGRMARARDFATRATQLDSENYQNWMQLGRVYRTFASLGIEGAYESAKKAYEKAGKLRPQSPFIFLDRAQLALVAGKTDEAKQMIQTALELRPNYSNAIFLLAQIQVNEGDIDSAIRSVEAAIPLNRNNPVAFFQLGLLYYSKENYEQAARAFARAVAINPQYANARYFLGLSQYWLGNRKETLAQFEEIQKTNPDNQEVKRIIDALRRGEDPFTGGAASRGGSGAGTRIEDLEELPIDEEDPVVNEGPQDTLVEEGTDQAN